VPRSLPVGQQQQQLAANDDLNTMIPTYQCPGHRLLMPQRQRYPHRAGWLTVGFHSHSSQSGQNQQIAIHSEITRHQHTVENKYGRPWEIYSCLFHCVSRMATVTKHRMTATGSARSRVVQRVPALAGSAVAWTTTLPGAGPWKL